MNKRNKTILGIVFLALLIAVFLAACRSSSATTAPATSAPASGSTANGQTLMQSACSACHSITRVTSAHKDAAQWKITVDRMIARGAQVSPQDEQTLIDYLVANFK